MNFLLYFDRGSQITMLKSALLEHNLVSVKLAPENPRDNCYTTARTIKSRPIFGRILAPMLNEKHV
ncbi:hypothetical protein BH10PLA2_BH10PLA2_21580 [soil metagenome]